MKHIIIALAAFTIILPIGCTATQLQQAQTDIVTGIQAACLDVANAAKLYPTSPVVMYGEAACPAGVAATSLVQNSATIQWLGGIAAQIQAAPKS